MKPTFAALAVATALLSSAANAATFSFSQTFSEGAIFSGSFEAEDLDNDNQIVSFTGELMDFTATFSGNSLVPALTFDLAGLFGLVFDLDGSPVLGNGVALGAEGLAVVDTTGTFAISVGEGPIVGACDGIGLCGSIADDIFFGTTVFDTTIDQLLVSELAPAPIPLPATGLLLIGALGLGVGAARRKRA